jgi:hypothetical protein
MSRADEYPREAHRVLRRLFLVDGRLVRVEPPVSVASESHVLQLRVRLRERRRRNVLLQGRVECAAEEGSQERPDPVL